MNGFQDWLVYLGVRGFFGLIGHLPRTLAYTFCETLASLVYWLDFKHRRIGMVNLSLAFPETSASWKARILQESFRELGRHAVEISRLPRVSAAELRQRVDYEPGFGLENYREARRKGRGVLFLTAHVSAWELLPAAHALFGHPLSFVVRPLDNPWLDRWTTRIRTRPGNQVIPKQQSLRRILRLLQQGQDVGLLIDQNVQEKDGVFVPLFGRPAATTASLAALALRTSAPVVPGFIRPGSRKGQYWIRFYPPLEAVRTGDEGRDLVENTAIYNRHIEQMVREFPHCWLWGHRRFRTQPDGTDPYS